MRYSISTTPRRICRLPRHSPVLVQVIDGAVRIGDSGEGLRAGGGITIDSTAGIQNWILPEMEVWAISDSGATMELIVP